MRLVAVQRESSESLNVTVAADNQGALSDSIQFALCLDTGSTRPTDWHSGAWATAPAVLGEDNVTWTRVALTPTLPVGVIALLPGLYRLYIQMSDSPETPVMLCGKVEVV